MRVLISGAGIAGPALARGLAKAGLRVTIAEKHHAILPYGQSVDIQGSAVTAVKKMGLLDEIKQFNTTERGTQFIDPKGRPFAPFPVNKGSTASFTSEFEILRGDLAAIFYKATKDHPNVSYLLGTTIKEVISNDDQTVKIELSNGQVQDFDLLVAADGQWSKVRKQCFPRSMSMWSIWACTPPTGPFRACPATMTGGMSTMLLGQRLSRSGPTHTAPSGQCLLSCPAMTLRKKRG